MPRSYLLMMRCCFVVKFKTHNPRQKNKYCKNATFSREIGITLGSFRSDYDYEIEYEYDFRISNQWHFQSPPSSCWF